MKVNDVNKDVCSRLYTYWREWWGERCILTGENGEKEDADNCILYTPLQGVFAVANLPEKLPVAYIMAC